MIRALVSIVCLAWFQVISEVDIEIVCKVAVTGKTGVEMEALTVCCRLCLLA